MRVEGEILKLLEFSGLPQGGGVNGDFLEILNNLIAQLIGGSNVPQNRVSNKASTPEFENTSIKKSKFDGLNASFIYQYLGILGNNTTISKKAQPENVSISRKSLSNKVSLVSTEKLRKLLNKDLKVKKFFSFSEYIIPQKFLYDFKGFIGKDINESFLIPEIKKNYRSITKEELSYSAEKPSESRENVHKDKGFIQFRYAEGVLKNSNKEVLKGGLKSKEIRELAKIGEAKRESRDSKHLEASSKAYEIQLSSVPDRVKESERVEGLSPVIKEAIFKEDGKIKKALVKLEDLNLEVKLVKDKVNLNFWTAQGKENLFGFFDYLKISQILNSIGLRVESFTVNGQELNKQRMRLKEKDNINLDELAQKGRDYLNGSPSFSVAL